MHMILASYEPPQSGCQAIFPRKPALVGNGVVAYIGGMHVESLKNSSNLVVLKKIQLSSSGSMSCIPNPSSICCVCAT